MIIEESDNRLSLHYEISKKQIIAILASVMVGILLFWISGIVNQESWIRDGLFWGGIILLLLAIIILSNIFVEYLSCWNCVFDREKGELCIQKRRLFWKAIKTYPLSEIRAVNMEDNEINTPDVSSGSRQVTLILHHINPRGKWSDSRLMLSGSIINSSKQRAIAERVAAFLGLEVTKNEF
jgi:hypothetical protein